MGYKEASFSSRDSIELKRSAKGEFSWNIKLYFDDAEQGFEGTVDELAAIHYALKEKFLS